MHAIVVLPPDDLTSAVRAFQERHAIDLPMVPHITVKAPPGLGAPDTWIETLRSVCDATAPFSLMVHGVGRFRDDVAYLAVVDPRGELHRLHTAVLNAVSPAGETASEGPAYVPHLTLWVRRSAPGLDPDVLTDDATTAFADPVAVPVHALSVFEFRADRWETCETVRLRGRRA